MALLGVHSYAHEYGAKILAPVHDEITFEVPEESVAEFGPRAQQTMEGIGRDFKLRVKLVAEPGVGRNWAEAKGH
jgi:DNA polymerase I-like protein with 3'-5' exonuclease and polymerase domains